MMSDLSLTDLLYAVIVVASTIGALILTTRPRRPLPPSTLRRLKTREKLQ